MKISIKAEVPAGALIFINSSCLCWWVNLQAIISCWPGFLVADHLSRRIIYWRGSKKHTESMEIGEQAQPEGRIQGSLDTGVRPDCQLHSQWLATPIVTESVLDACLYSSAADHHLLHPCVTFQNLRPSDCTCLPGSWWRGSMAELWEYVLWGQSSWV